MSARLPELLWPRERLGEALLVLAQATGLGARAALLPAVPPARSSYEMHELSLWLSDAADLCGIEAEPAQCTYAELPSTLGQAPPVLCLGPAGEGLLVMGVSRGKVKVIHFDGSRHKLPLAEVVDWLRGPLRKKAELTISRVLKATSLEGEQAERARRAVLDERLGHRSISGLLLLRPGPGAPLSLLLRRAGALQAAGLLLLTWLASSALGLLGWGLLGGGALSGNSDPGWLWAWVLVLLTSLGLRGAAMVWQGRFALAFGGVLKQRLLIGALRLAPEELKARGMGDLLGRVIESDALEALALSAGLGVLAVGVDFLLAGLVLSVVPSLLVLLGAWALGVLVLGLSLLLRRDEWTRRRIRLTEELVDRMLGHRTRLAQQARGRWHEGEDAVLAEYLDAARGLDSAVLRLMAASSRGFILCGLAVLGLSSWTSLGPGAFALALGGVMLGAQALEGLTSGASALAGAWVAWTQVKPLLTASTRPLLLGTPELALGQEQGQGELLLVGRGLRQSYGGGLPPVLKDLDLELRRRDRVLLEGASGGGKSTLASVLVALRRPESGLLLLEGADLSTLGEARWRRLATAAPQFHENRVLVGTLLFNLTLGARTEHEAQGARQAEALCRDLGLGPLLDRMPAGILQMVGETGWDLSHGERSRVYLARALLQGAQLVVLDESFGALDPVTMAQCLRVVLERAPALVVIAHP